MNWTDGYHSEIIYTKGLQTEQLVAPMRLAMALGGRGGAALDSSAFAFCELGCGRGLTATAVAASFPQAQVYANDFNPSHVLEARSLAKAAALDNLHLFDEDFAAFSALELPDFDVISLHGIYSWVSPTQHEVIRRFVAHRLKPGGVCYVSYNALPGWSQLMPLRRLVLEVAQGQSGKPAAERVTNGIGLLQALRSVNAGYLEGSRTANTWLDGIVTKDPAYLIHELLNEHSCPEHFVDMARDMQGIRLSFAGSATLVDHMVDRFLAEPQRRLLEGIADPLRRETVRDFLLNQQFRRDLYQKGQLSLSATERDTALMGLRFTRIQPAGGMVLKKKVAYGEVSLDEVQCPPVMMALQQEPRTVAQLLQVESVRARGLSALLDTLLALTVTGQCAPALSAAEQKAAKPGCDRLNHHILLRNDTPQASHVLVSPVTGAGVPADRVQQWFLLAEHAKQGKPVEFALERVLASEQPTLEHDGRRIESACALREEIARRYQIYADHMLPLYRYLQVA